jgi:hypothetical protein
MSQSMKAGRNMVVPGLNANPCFCGAFPAAQGILEKMALAR